MAKKAAPKKAAPEKVVEPTPPPPPPVAPARLLYRSFDEYAKANPTAASMKGMLGVDYYRSYLLFPIDPEKHPVHLPGGYYFGGVDGYAPGTLKSDKPHYWTSVYNGHHSMRRWAFTEEDALESLQEIAILLPTTDEELEHMGFVAEP
jgi:hypothetical protein